MANNINRNQLTSTHRAVMQEIHMLFYTKIPLALLPLGDNFWRRVMVLAGMIAQDQQVPPLRIVVGEGGPALPLGADVPEELLTLFEDLERSRRPCSFSALEFVDTVQIDRIRKYLDDYRKKRSNEADSG